MPAITRRHIAFGLPTLALNIRDSQAEDSRQEVDLLLVLAIDASRSVDTHEWELNKKGYAEALVHSEVLSAIRSGAIGAIGIAAIKWGNWGSQQTVLPWTLINDKGSAEIAASKIRGLGYASLGRTSISGGILFSTELIEHSPFAAIRKVIDVSGDGFDNTNRTYPLPGDSWSSYFSRSREAPDPSSTELVRRTRDSTIKKGITINGLPILKDMPWLDEYYSESVIGGPRSFVIAANDFDSFRIAVRRKLVLEIAGVHPRSTHA